MKRILFQSAETAVVITASVAASVYAARATRYAFERLRDYVGE